MSLHPLTIKSIQGSRLLKDWLWHCGCNRLTTQWRLCEYHQGYEDAAQAQQERLDETVRLLRDQHTRVILSSWHKDRGCGVCEFYARIDGGEQQ